MFNDIWIARKNAMSLAKTLMVATMVIAIGTQYAVITADLLIRVPEGRADRNRAA
ncbi:hypothetical protein [Sphingomonas sp. NFX23]|uniref:hypothetical protein n=1 Tax=Sphingomonas sp. NFX23 TaxID=2819532 RepID=UPI003CFA36C8